MPWRVVEVDVPEEEATVIWSAQEQSSALYKVDDLAKIISDSNDCSYPTSTAVAAGAFCVSIGNEIHIFDGERSNFLATVTLESDVDTMAWSPDSQFLVIGDNSGTIHFFSFSCKDVVFSTDLVNIARENDHPNRVFCNCVFNVSDEDDQVDLTLLSVDGCLFTFKGLPLKDLSDALHSRDLAVINKIKGSIRMKTFEVSNIHGKVKYCSAATLYGMSSLIVAGDGNATLSIWSDNTITDAIDCELLTGANARKCLVSPDGKYLVVLDEQLNLSIWDAHSLVMLCILRSGVSDFIISSSAATGEADVMGSDIGQVVLLAANENESKLEIYQLPLLQKIYTMEVSLGCSLAESSSYQERVFYIEKNTSELTNNNAAHLVYKCLSESSPDHRLYSLVRKKKFQSALEFAKAFALDTEFIYKAKSSVIVSEISTMISENEDFLEERASSVDTLINELQKSLQNVKSVEFSVDCCLKAFPPKLEQVYKLLCFAKEKVSQAPDKEKHKYKTEMTDVLHSLYRLETFKMVFGDSCFTVHKWRQFCAGEMLSHVTHLLSQGKMSSAAIIWRRHESELKQRLTADSLQTVLMTIRSDLPSSRVISWLREYLVPVVMCCPNNETTLIVLASWLEQRITSLELSEKEGWPNNGLEMAKLVFDVHSKCTQEASNYEHFPTPLLVNQVHGLGNIQVCKNLGKPNPVLNLWVMVEHITELEKLHANYNCQIPLAEFTKETSLGIMFKMLDSVLAIELIPSVVNSQITQYGIQHGFQIDDVLLKYISNEVKQVSVSNLSNTLHEARLVEIAKCIKTRAVRFEAVLQLMSWATVPWSEVIENMVQNAMIEDPSNEQLMRSYRLMELKKILSHYGLRGIDFTNDSHVKGVVEYILGTANETALEDALQIVETYHCLTEEEVYYIRLQNLCLKGLLPECIVSLKMIRKTQLKSVVKRFLTWVSVMLQDHPVDKEDSQERIAVLEAAVCILEHVRDIDKLSSDTKGTLENLKNILALQQDFSIFVAIGDYRDVKTREQFLFNYIKEHNIAISILTQKSEDGKDFHVVLSRLASLFGLSVLQLQSKVLLHNIPDPEITSNTVSLCKKWLTSITQELSPDEIFNLCKAIFQNHIIQDNDTLISMDANVAEILYWLTSCVLAYGKASNLDSYIEFGKLCWLSTSFNAHCESGGLSLSSATCEEDPLQSWSSFHWFKDNGFVLDATLALPLQYKALVEAMIIHEDPLAHLEKLMVACRNLVEYLRENNLHEMALQYVLYCLNNLIQFTELQSNAENLEKNPKLTSLKAMKIHGCDHVADMLINLFSKVLQSSHIDHDLALGYLCSVPEDKAILMLKSDFAAGQCHSSSKVATIFTVAIYYAINFCQMSTVKTVKELYSAALWHSRLTKYHIAGGNLLSGDKKEARNVLEALSEKSGIDVKIIVEFCKAFDFDVDNVMHSYIRNLSSVPITLVEDNLLFAMNFIANEASLFSTLKEVLESLSPYDYDRIAIILHAITKHTDVKNETQFERQLEVLEMLTKYQRRAPPREYEQNYQLSGSSVDGKKQTEFSNESKQGRLPFHLLVYGNPWKIIAPELNDETTPKLLPLCRLLKLQEDQVYVNAVNNLVSSCLLVQHPNPASTVPTSRNSELPSCQFEKGAKLLSAIKNPEVAVKTAITLLSKWPQSKEKVQAAEATVKLASKWVSSSEGSDRQTAEKIYKIAKEKAQVIAIEYVLVASGVMDESFLNLKHKPATLLMHLYKVYGCLPPENRPNVHKIASEIASISDLNINKVRSHLLETWLHTTYPGSIRSPEYSNSGNKANDCDNLKRVMYLLEDSSMQNKYALFLLNFAYKSGQSKINYQSRVRAIEVLVNVASHNVIEGLANDTLEGIRNYMKSLYYLSELEHLHISQTVESFQRCNKEGLVKGLWKNHKDNANAVMLIADICLDNKMCDPQVWTNILRQLLHLGLYKYLGNILPLLTEFTSLWQTSNLIKIWEQLTFLPLQKAISPLSTGDQCLCESSMMLLQKCPIMVDVDILKVFQKLVELGLFSCAFACFSLLPSDRKPNFLKSLISSASVIDALDAIAKDEAVGHGFVSPNVVETIIFEHVIARSSYEPFKGSDHLIKLADYLISQRKLHLMIVQLIKFGDIELAVELVQHYEMCGSPCRKTFLKKHDVPGLGELLCFLESFGVLDETLPYLPAFDVSEVDEEKPTLEVVVGDEQDEATTADDVDIFDVF